VKKPPQTYRERVLTREERQEVTFFAKTLE
jgi:hypothetical protein